ncbi:hypothetical protein HAX54_014831, partial [Datura stramonium]|nr:hypothetical protein [Datura stramonium]
GLCNVRPGFEEPLDYDDATVEEQAKVDSDCESDDNEDDYDMEEAILGPTYDED